MDGGHAKRAVIQRADDVLIEVLPPPISYLPKDFTGFKSVVETPNPAQGNKQNLKVVPIYCHIILNKGKHCQKFP
jgi:hypothetical protein